MAVYVRTHEQALAIATSDQRVERALALAWQANDPAETPRDRARSMALVLAAEATVELCRLGRRVSWHSAVAVAIVTIGRDPDTMNDPGAGVALAQQLVTEGCTTPDAGRITWPTKL